MTYLELCRMVRRECRIPGTGPTTVESPTGLIADVVAAVQAAWTDIQLHHYESWSFMRRMAEAQLIPERKLYTLADLEAGDAARLDSIQNALGEPLHQADITALMFQQDHGGAPRQWALTADNTIEVHPTPNQIHPVKVIYQRTPQTLTQDSDVPHIPAHHHAGIAWKAVMDITASESDAVLYQKAMEKYEQYFSRLESDYLPPMTIGGRF